MKTKFVFCAALFFLTAHLKAQEKSYFAELVPPSPDVAQLGQYGATQVGKYTGTANVSVPLHSIDLDGLQIPIVLSYQTGGIKVAQEASWVGLGWNLSANAVITKQTNGYDDLTNNAGAIGYLYSPSYTFNQLTPAQETTLLNAYNNVPHDTEPDLFTANIFGQSVQFMLPKKGATDEVQAIVLNDNLIKIYYYVNNDRFKVVNGQGYEFNFGGANNEGSKEYTTIYRSDGANHQTDASALSGSIAYQTSDNERTLKKHSAWHVDDVIAPSGRTIDFTYQKVSYFGYPSYSESRNFTTCTNATSSNGVGYMDFDSSTTKNVTCTITGFQAVQLTKIAGDFGEVNFTLASREDISSRYQTRFNDFPSAIPSGNPIKRLSGITVKNSLNQTIKTITFDNNGYFNSHKNSDTGIYKKERYIRLKLDGVTINDQTYSFDYIQPNDLPDKDSKDEDFWGYYNGKGNTIRMPSFGRLTFCNTNQREVFFNLDGANRGADFNYGRIGLLNKVTYPTKGYTEFEYEGNTALVDKPTSTGYSNPYSNSSDLSYNYQYLKRTLIDGYKQPLSDGDIFTISSFDDLPFAYNVEVDWEIKCDPYVASSCGGYTGGQYVYRIVKLDNPGAGDVVQSQMVQSVSVSSPLGDLEQESLANGTYRFEAPDYSPPQAGAFLTVNASAHYLKDPEESPFPWEEFDVGGVRVKTVTNKDSNGSFIGKKEYGYDASNYGQIVSSGKLMNQLVYHSKYGFLDYTPQDFGQVFTMSSGSSTSLDFSAEGSHIGYSYVEEYDVSENGTKKGKVQTAYENLPNELLTYYVGTTPLQNYTGNNISSGGLFGYDVHYGNAYLIGVPPKTYSHRNGRVLWEEVEDSGFNILKRVDNTLTDYNLNTLPVFKAYFSSVNIVATYGYDQLGDKSLPTVSETRDYFGNDFITTTVTTQYEPINYLPRSVTTTTSENNVTNKQETFYVFDLAHGLGSEPHRSTRMGRNQLTDPVLIRTYEDNNLLSETKFKYGSFFGDIWRTEAQEAKDGDPLTQRMDFVSYDDLGNLTEYKRTNGMSVSYIWGYDQMYPVAKVENATRSQIDAILGSNFNAGTGSLNATQETNLRNGLSSAMVTTYTYKPGVGMTSMTDPHGYRMNYEYDSNNRLKKVKDAANDVVNKYEYHYKGQ